MSSIGVIFWTLCDTTDATLATNYALSPSYAAVSMQNIHSNVDMPAPFRRVKMSIFYCFLHGYIRIFLLFFFRITKRVLVMQLRLLFVHLSNFPCRSLQQYASIVALRGRRLSSGH